MTIINWPEIVSFHNLRKQLGVIPAHDPGLGKISKVNYRSKIKLHGTNAGIQHHSDGSVVAQSRTTILSPTQDNFGFGKWVKENEEYWTVNNSTGHYRSGLIIFGEWAGSGVNKDDVAISSLPQKIFVVFAAQKMDDPTYFITEPELLSEMVKGIPNTYVLPWHKEIEIDWSKSDEELSTVVNSINDWVHQVEKIDPWVKENFNLLGTGEGIVFYPSSKEHSGKEMFSNLAFKAKGEKHRVLKTKAPAQLNPEVAANIEQFVELVLTEARLNQGVNTIGGFEAKLTGKFVNWISEDIQKETKDELQASNLEWKQVQKSILDKARSWYLNFGSKKIHG